MAGTRSVAVRELLDRARSRVSRADVERFVGPVDPGWGEYLAAMTALLHRGEPALADSRYAGGTLDFEEPIHCAQWDTSAGDDPRFWWYRLMCSSAALLDEHRTCFDNEHYFLGTILSDSRALGDDGALQLAAAVCREVRDVRPWGDLYPFTFLGELLMTDVEPRTDAELEAMCDQFEAVEQERCASGNYSSPEYFWGLTVFDQLHPLWLSLVASHFPTRIPKAAELRRMLLEHGARWRAADEPA